jgi:hypothetical protein
MMTSPAPRKSTRTVPSFVVKLFNIVCNPLTNRICCWSENGKSFVVHSVKDFCSQCLKGTFKSDKFPSFVRQLHFYGFTKLSVPPPGNTTTTFIFYNEHFTRYARTEELYNIQRKTNSEFASKLTKEMSTMQQNMEVLHQEKIMLDSQLNNANHRADVAEEKLGKSIK